MPIFHIKKRPLVAFLFSDNGPSRKLFTAPNGRRELRIVYASQAARLTSIALNVALGRMTSLTFGLSARK